MSIPDSVEVLNEREQEIIECLVDGLSNREIADKLFLAPSTVKWYIRQLNQKLDTTNRHEIVEQVQELGLLEAEVPQESYFRPRENLPRQTTPFVGRDSELDELHAIIEKEDIRLLTILAPGGMGKTRIALEATEQQINRFPDGVYFVPLQALSEPEQIISQIASSTFFAFQNDNRSQKQQVLDFLSNKQMLLCIDNWEHLLNGALLLNEILEVAPDVKIIATSREKLNLLAETVYVLQGMQFPEWETPDDALRYDAVQLLLQSAQRVKPDWTITEENLDYVARVCRLTQGMPLGILLASSWLDVYSLERICEEIKKSADILETDMRDVPERQRSIRAVFDYSWERLKPKEQDVLIKMSIFRGGCSPEAAEAITGANPRILQSLVNKALLHRNKDGRYDLHELLRQYAEKQLETAHQTESSNNSHSHYYLEQLDDLADDLKGKNQFTAFSAIKIDIENVKIAWRWAISQGKVELIDGAIESLFIYYSYYGDNDDPEAGYQLFELARIRLAPRDNETAHGAYGKVLSRFNNWNLDDLKAGLAIARTYENSAEIGYCLGMIALIHLSQNKKHESYEYIDKSLSAVRDAGDKFWLVHWLIESGYIFLRYGDIDNTVPHHEEARLLIQEIGDSLFLPQYYKSIFFIDVINGDLEAALQSLETGLRLPHLGQAHLFASYFLDKGLILLQLGRLETVQDIVNKYMLIGEDLNSPVTIGLAQYLGAMLATAEGNYSPGLEMGEVALSNTRGLPDSNQLPWTPALAACGLQKYDLAVSYIIPALEYALRVTSEYIQLRCLSTPALVFAHRGDLVRATELASMVYTRPTSINHYWDIDPQFTQLMEHLQTELDENTFNSAWERGKTLDVIQVIEELLDEFRAES